MLYMDIIIPFYRLMLRLGVTQLGKQLSQNLNLVLLHTPKPWLIHYQDALIHWVGLIFTELISIWRLVNLYLK